MVYNVASATVAYIKKPSNGIHAICIKWKKNWITNALYKSMTFLENCNSNACWQKSIIKPDLTNQKPQLTRVSQTDTCNFNRTRSVQQNYFHTCLFSVTSSALFVSVHLSDLAYINAPIFLWKAVEAVYTFSKRISTNSSWIAIVWTWILTSEQSERLYKVS